MTKEILVVMNKVLYSEGVHVKQIFLSATLFKLSTKTQLSCNVCYNHIRYKIQAWSSKVQSTKM